MRVGSAVSDAVTEQAEVNALQLYEGSSLKDVANFDTTTLATAGQNYLDAQTTPAANDARTAAGAQAAMSLAQNGFNPDNPDDTNKLVHITAAAYGLICAVCGALVEVGNAFGRWAMPKLDAAIYGPYGCKTSGNWTVRQVLSNSGIATVPHGGLAGLMVPLLAQGYADRVNCKDKGAVPFGYHTSLGPGLRFWDSHSSGARVEYFVPCIDSSDWPGNTYAGAPDSLAGMPRGDGGPFVFPSQGPFAFLPLSQVPLGNSKGQWIRSPLDEGRTWMRVAGNAGPLNAPPVVLPKVITLRLHPKTIQAVQSATGAPAGPTVVALKKVLTLKLPQSSAGKAQAAADLANMQSPAARALVGAASAALGHAPEFWVAYYSQIARDRPLPSTHPYAATIARDLPLIVAPKA